jgi:hypothetical protein
MDANAPFDKAVKYLFRHLHDPRALARNPLVRHIFDHASILGVGEERDRAALARIHRLVRQGAEHFRDMDLSVGKRRRGLRQYAIIMQQCFERRPIRDVAVELGISNHHCYRERANICRRVAQFICERNDVPVLDYRAEIDEFRIQVDRADRQAASGAMEAAFRSSDGLVRAASSTDQKVEALCQKAIISLVFGNQKRADGAVSEAKALLAEPPGGNTTRAFGLSHIWIELTACKFAQFRGDVQEAVRLGQRAIMRLEPLQTRGELHFKKLYTESLYEVGAAFWNLGDRDRSYEHIVKAEESLRYLPAMYAELRSQVSVTLWKYRSRLLMNSKSWYPLWQRLRALAAVFEEAYASGSLFQAMDALGVIAESNAQAGQQTEALRAAELAVSLARHHANEKIRTQVPIDIAARLLPTQCWEKALAFHTEVRRLDSCEAGDRAIASYFTTFQAFRLHRFQDAWRLANAGNEFPGYAAVALMKRLIAAAAASQLGWQPEARVILDAVIPQAEALGSAPILRSAYGIAAKVAGDDPRFARKARELSRLLST